MMITPRFRSILCVDDQRLVHRFHDLILAPYVREGARILHAYDGAEALKIMGREEDVDLVLLDINMPVLNGLAFLDQKQRTDYAAVPVIVISNEGDRPDEIAHAMSLGAARVLAKPFEFQDLDSCVRSVFAEMAG